LCTFNQREFFENNLWILFVGSWITVDPGWKKPDPGTGMEKNSGSGKEKIQIRDKNL
jgi:hypothetical protein